MLLALLLMQGVPAQAGGQQTVEAGFSAPESLAPAIETYLGCLGPTMQGISRKAGPQFADGMRKVVDQTLEHCAPSRAKARRLGLRLIQGDAKVAAADREATVDHTLAEIDAVFRRMPDQLPPEERPEAEKARP
ncbi:hypothetical protein [Sphingomonas leidyi]|jgi:hypothetical protein|nr:hypothetical protein [Sphingomonas leidyi]